MRKGIILGIGILVILLALAGTGSAHGVYGFSCTYCHTGFGGPLIQNGTDFKNTHKFDGIVEPLTTATSCTHCHVDPSNANFNLKSNGTTYNNTHRYNATTLASVKLIGNNGCNNCHNNTAGNNFSLISGAGTSLLSATCDYCHPILVNDWRLSKHSSPTKNVSAADALKNVSGTFIPGPVECTICHNEHNSTARVVLINTTCTADSCHAAYNKTTLVITNNLSKHSYNLTECKYCHLPQVLRVNSPFDTRSHTWDFNTQLNSSADDERHNAALGDLKNVTKYPGITNTSCGMCHGGNSKMRSDLNVKSYSLSKHYNATVGSSTPYCTDCHKTALTTEAKLINGTNTCNVGCHASLIHVNASKIGSVDCVNCHFNSSDPLKSHNLTIATVSDYKITCTICHTANTNKSIIPEINEWDTSKHNGTTHNSSSCIACHSPMADDKGVTCSICHNIHDMVEWLNKTKVAFGVEKSYGRYNASAVGKYTMMANTTELCGNCHMNRASYSVPGWNSKGPHGVVVPHYSNQKDVFLGSVKQLTYKFECIDCHMYINTTTEADDSNKSTGHSFVVNAEGLQTKSECNYCHVNGTKGVDTIPKVIAKIKFDTQEKWNRTNDTVEGSYKYINESLVMPKNLSMDKLAQAFFKLYTVSKDASWGVHDPIETNQLLDDAAALAIAANASLGQVTSSVDLVTGWNLVALNGTPSVTAPVSVLSSVSSNITVVWGYNATVPKWELYDPAMPTSLNDLTAMVPGKGYWINAIKACKWTV